MHKLYERNCPKINVSLHAPLLSYDYTFQLTLVPEAFLCHLILLEMQWLPSPWEETLAFSRFFENLALAVSVNT